ncbi:MAG: polysaccharide lyase family protein [Planctomycetaceae bacterium]|nr:polysaccharide lyase family protein [Planctomycetaceae bacterium]
MKHSLLILLLLATMLLTSATMLLAADAMEPPLEADAIFCIGTPDARCGEFALVREGYAAFPQLFRRGVLYEVGKSTPEKDWPFVHPSIRDRSWAGGGDTYPFTIRFNVDEEIAETTTLIIGYMGTLPGGLSTIHVTANATALPTQQPTQIDNNQAVFQPRTARGRPTANLFTIPAGTFKKGDNTITITLVGGSWILYDYVALRKEAKPLAMRERPQPDLLTKFRTGEDAPMADVKQIVFAVRVDNHEHWYANFGRTAECDESHPYQAHDGAFHNMTKPAPAPVSGGKLGIYDLDTKAARYILEDDTGSVRDPIVHYGGEKILFSYRPGGTLFFHLYEIDVDGTNLKQLTDGEFDDFEPTYTPEGKIVFVSSRGKRYVQCWMTQVAILYGCDADGQNVHVLSGNVEHDNTPWVLPNGQIMYTRWEYVDRSQVDYHHLWTMNPDGTRQMVFYGNLHPGVVYIDAKPIPNSEKMVASFSWGHGRAEHMGAIGIIDPRKGPDDRSAAVAITSDSTFKDPWAFSETAFIAARNAQMVLVDADGNEQVVFELPEELRQKRLWLNEPRPIIPRAPERVIGSVTNPTKATGQLLVMDVHQGRNMEGVQPGEIKKLLILETLPKPINFTGGMEPMSYGGSFTMERIVGTVPVEADGSANFELPATRAFFFVALDENDRAVKRMQSFHSVMPGEVTACIGCHEERTMMTTTVPRVTTASRRPPSPITPIADYRGIDPATGNRLSVSTGIPDVIDYPRDVQPIWDRHCIACHSPEKREGNFNLSGGRGPMYSISYSNIMAHTHSALENERYGKETLVADGRNRALGSYPPKTLGSGASALYTKYIQPEHYDVELSEREKAVVRLWIETGATYLGAYAGLGSGMLGGYLRNSIDRRDLEWAETKAMQEVMQNNCASCHTGNRQLPISVSDEIRHTWWVYPNGPTDSRRQYSRHLHFDLTYPEKSIMLLAPLAKSAGGLESCGRAILTGTGDPRYQAILSGIVRAQQRLDEIKRFDMPDFVARPEYIREMKAYGILPAEHDPSSVVDVYDLEQRYWRSLWYVPVE